MPLFLCGNRRETQRDDSNGSKEDSPEKKRKISKFLEIEKPP